MKSPEAAPSIVEDLRFPRLIQLEHNLYAAAFSLMKLLPAHFILERAREEGLVSRGSTIIETTSGTFGLALAMVGALRGYRTILVSDPAIDDALQRRLEDLGATVEIVREPATVGGFQQARLDRMAQLQRKFPDHLWPSQYRNPQNPTAYAPLAEYLVERLGQIDCLVGTVGSGGSMCGTSNFLRLIYPELYAVGVDTFGSVIFGQEDSKRLVRGLGNSLVPDNVDHTVFNEVHWVGAPEAFLATRQLHRQHALYMGGTSGAAYTVARWWAAQHPDKITVTLLPDEGYRYQNTIYKDEWLLANDVWLGKLPDAPRKIVDPKEQCAGWAFLDWSRREYSQIADVPVTS